MAARLVTIRGRVRPGPTMRPPYAEGHCVIWGARKSDRARPAGGALPFVVEAQSGEEFLVDCVGAAAVIRVRSELALPDLRMKTSAIIRYGVGWIEPGDVVVVRGRAGGSPGAPFRGGPRRFQATQVRQVTRAREALRVQALHAGEAEEPDAPFVAARAWGGGE